MNQNYIISIHISLDFCIFCLIFLSRRISGAHYQYEACVPKDCGNGQNISFPFYIPRIQDSFCGYPGFVLECGRDGFPVLKLSGIDYIVRRIFYEKRTLTVSNSAIFSSNSNCLPRISNTTLDTGHFDYVNVRSLHLLSNCTKQLDERLFGNRVSECEDRDDWTLALYDGDENLRDAIGNCKTNVVAPVDEDRGIGNGGVVEILRRGFVLNWTASDCNTCRESGGRCGFEETVFQFRCFCPDRPHSSSCKPGLCRWANLVTRREFGFSDATLLGLSTDRIDVDLYPNQFIFVGFEFESGHWQILENSHQT